MTQWNSSSRNLEEFDDETTLHLLLIAYNLICIYWSLIRTMILTQAQYDRMKSVVDELIRSNNRLHPHMAVDLGVEYDALLSLFGQVFIRHLKMEIKTISEAKMSSIVERAAGGESLVAMSNEFHFGSFKFAKLYLEAIGEGNLPLSSIMTEPEHIKDGRIRSELLHLLEMDPVCSHELELVKECSGREYEEMLINLLNEKKMCFETESQLRSRGKPKTPDVLFLIPMATKITSVDVCDHSNQTPETPNTVSNPTVLQDTKVDAEQGGRPLRLSAGGTSIITNGSGSKVVINWIDSKAMFADVATFRENLPQFRAYNNRYGRGMVIYWHGFAEAVRGELADDMIIVRDCLPEDWIFPTGEPADGRTPAFDNIAY